jgi:hypothetical protein
MSYDQIVSNALYEQNPNLSTRELSEKSRYETDHEQHDTQIIVARRKIRHNKYDWGRKA